MYPHFLRLLFRPRQNNESSKGTLGSLRADMRVIPLRSNGLGDKSAGNIIKLTDSEATSSKIAQPIINLYNISAPCRRQTIGIP